MPHGKREEGTVAKVVLCRVEVSTATQTNRTAVAKSFFWSVRNLEQMQDRQYECVDGYACDYMIGDYHYGHASDYGGRREALLPKPFAAPLSLESGVIVGIRHPKQQFPLLNSGRTGMSAIGISVP